MDVSTTFASMRKKVASLSVAALVASLFAMNASAQTTQTFSDVPVDAWFHPYVEQLVSAGVIDSTQANYRPADLVNRAEMAKMAVEAAGLTLETATSAPFTDVPMGQWYTNYVYTAQKNGVLSGYKNESGAATGTFGPGNNLNRAEASKIIVNAFALAEDTSGAPHFPDVTSSDWFYVFVESAFNSGVVAGYPDGSFKPANNINRAEIAKMVSLGMAPIEQGFVLKSAGAASSTKVELIFSQGVEKASAEVAANYTIEDSAGSALNVTSAQHMGGDVVVLNTAAHVEGKVYYVSARNVKSAEGANLDSSKEVSFLGYGSDVSGGALTVALSTSTPVSGSVPGGANGVTFSCWDFKAGSEAALVKSLTVKRVGPGAPAAFDNVYLYKGDARLTTGRSLNSQSNSATFSNINQTVAANSTLSLCLVADLESGSTGGVHAFEITDAGSVVSNSSNLTGSFPARGAEQLVTSATVGTATVTKNGSLSEVAVGNANARVAQFKIAAGSQEDQELRRVALYVNSRATLSNFKLYVEGNSSPLASSASIGGKDLVTFSLATPFKVERSQSKIFYVTASVDSARTGDTVKMYLDETTDLNMVGKTYGYGVAVQNGEGVAPFTNKFDSSVAPLNIKVAKFNIASNSLPAGEIAVNQKNAVCLDLNLTNGQGQTVDLKDWSIKLDGSAGTNLSTDYSNVRLALLNADGSIAGSLFDSVEPTAVGISETLTVRGTYSINAGQTVRAGIVVDVNSVATAGETLKCTLVKMTGDMVKVNNDSISGDVVPQSDITGTAQTVVMSNLVLNLGATPSENTAYAAGQNNVSLLGFQAKAGSANDTTIKSLVLEADNALTATAVRDIVDSIGLYNQAGELVSELQSFSSGTNPTLTFNNLDIKVNKNQTVNLVVKGNVSSTTAAEDVEFNIDSGLAIDQNGEDITVGNTAVRTIKLGVTTNVNPSGTITNDPKLYSPKDEFAAYKFRLKATNGSATVKKLNMTVETSNLIADNLAAVEAKLGKGTSGTCEAPTSSQTFVLAGVNTGTVEFTNVGIALPDNQDTYLCVFLKAIDQVTSNKPQSGSDLVITALSVVPSNGVGDELTPVDLIDGVTPGKLEHKAGYFFQGSPKFEKQAIDMSALANGERTLFNFVANEDGNVQKLDELVFSSFGNATVSACKLERNGSLLMDETSAGPVFADVDWTVGATYTVKCDVAGVIAGSNSLRLDITGVEWTDGNAQDGSLVWADVFAVLKKQEGANLSGSTLTANL